MSDCQLQWHGGVSPSRNHVLLRIVATPSDNLSDRLATELDTICMATDSNSACADAMCIIAPSLPVATAAAHSSNSELPTWFTALASLPHHELLKLNSYETNEWRLEQNYMHSPSAPCRVLAYILDSQSLTLHGVAHFTSQAQGHLRVAHGGTMTALMECVCKAKLSCCIVS